MHIQKENFEEECDSLRQYLNCDRIVKFAKHFFKLIFVPKIKHKMSDFLENYPWNCIGSYVAFFIYNISKRILSKHYGDIWARRSLKSPASRLFTQVLFRRRSKKTSNSASLAFVMGIHWWPVHSPHKGPVTRKMFPFDDVIMGLNNIWTL